MSAQNETIDLMSPRAEVQRIDHTASMWFAAALLASAIALLALLVTGFHPANLGGGGEVAWWIGATLNAIGLAAIGYAGCPIYWGSVEVAHIQKSICVRGGLVFFLLGAWIAIIAILM